MNKLDTIFADTTTPAQYARAYADHLVQLLQHLDQDAVGQLISHFLETREKGKKIFFCGNGGSAATASHFANDIAIGTRSLDKPFRAISLTDNVAILTAIANDDGYDYIFVQQLQNLMEPGDIVVAISASGNSANVVRALEHAKQQGNLTIALTGFSGGRIKEVADFSIHIKTTPGEYGPVEDMHMILDHLIGSYLMRAIHG